MCLVNVQPYTIARMTGNPTAQQVWLRTQVLRLVRDYPELLAEALELGQPVTQEIDGVTYELRHGLPPKLRKKLERLHKLASEVTDDVLNLPKSGKMHLHGEASKRHR